MGEPFEIITVPDFAAEAGEIFEARTLLFLASWLENAGEARNFPLHLACIGEPPSSVRRMAARAGAIVSVHKPVKLANAHTANKLRGLEIEARTARFLLVDTDIVFLGDISSLQGFPDSLVVAPGGGAKVPFEFWKRLYVAMDLDFPEERMPLLRAELDMPPADRENFTGQNSSTVESPPYYNSGVLLASWRYGLRSLWQECLERGASVVDEHEPGSAGVLCSDQAGFALAVASLKAQGVEFHRLPDTMHVRWGHLYRGQLPPSEMRILHTTGMMMGLADSEKLTAGSPASLERWCERTGSKLSSLFQRDFPHRTPTAVRRFIRGQRRLGEVRERLMQIYRNQIDGKI